MHVITRAATPAVEAFGEQQPGITLALRDYRDGDLEGAWYAIAATDDLAVNAAIVAEAERRQIFCVRADAARGHRVTPPPSSTTACSSACWVGGEHRRSAAIRSAIREAFQQGRIAPDISGAADAMKGGVALVGGGPGTPS